MEQLNIWYSVQFFLYLKDTYITGTAQHLLFPTGFETDKPVET